MTKRCKHVKNLGGDMKEAEWKKELREIFFSEETENGTIDPEDFFYSQLEHLILRVSKESYIEGSNAAFRILNEKINESDALIAAICDKFKMSKQDLHRAYLQEENP